MRALPLLLRYTPDLKDLTTLQLLLEGAARRPDSSFFTLHGSCSSVRPVELGREDEAWCSKRPCLFGGVQAVRQAGKTDGLFVFSCLCSLSRTKDVCGACRKTQRGDAPPGLTQWDRRPFLFDCGSLVFFSKADGVLLFFWEIFADFVLSFQQ